MGAETSNQNFGSQHARGQNKFTPRKDQEQFARKSFPRKKKKKKKKESGAASRQSLTDPTRVLFHRWPLTYFWIFISTFEGRGHRVCIIATARVGCYANRTFGKWEQAKERPGESDLLYRKLPPCEGRWTLVLLSVPVETCVQVISR